MNSFTSMIRAKVSPLVTVKASGEQLFEAHSQMQVLEPHQLRCIAGGDETDAPKGSWFTNTSA